jgi:hypothetical protein
MDDLEDPFDDLSGEPEKQPDQQPSASSQTVVNKRGGPVTPEGKKKVSKNAVRHGLTSLDPTAAGESTEEWHFFLEGFNETFRPVGIPETELVFNLAMCLWRKRRIVRAERGNINQLRERIDEQGIRPNMSNEQREVLRRRHLRISLPDAKRIDTLIRYEAQIDRSFARSLQQLELLQRVRSGQEVSPPVRIQVSDDRSEVSMEARGSGTQEQIAS